MLGESVLSKTVIKEDEEWIEQIRHQTLQLFQSHDRKLDSYFQYAIMSASFIYGTGTLAVVPHLPCPQVRLVWLTTLTAGVLGIVVSFALASAYTYQWFDHARVGLLLIENFYDKQKGDQSRRILVWQAIRADSYWEKEFLPAFKSGEESRNLFIRSGGVNYINWMKSLGTIISHPRPILDVGRSFARVISIVRRPYLLVAYIIVSISLAVCYSLSVLPPAILANWFLLTSAIYAAGESANYYLFGRPGARLVSTYR